MYAVLTKLYLKVSDSFFLEDGKLQIINYTETRLRIWWLYRLVKNDMVEFKINFYYAAGAFCGANTFTEPIAGNVPDINKIIFFHSYLCTRDILHNFI